LSAFRSTHRFFLSFEKSQCGTNPTTILFSILTSEFTTDILAISPSFPSTELKSYWTTDLSASLFAVEFPFLSALFKTLVSAIVTTNELSDFFSFVQSESFSFQLA
jgi:hypothetical protein